LGITNVFSAWWFIALLCVLAASVMVCSTRRFATVRRAGGSVRRRALGSLLTHVSILLILSGAVIRGVWGEKGFIELREGQILSRFAADKGSGLLPFEMRLEKFEIETYDDEAVASSATKLAVQRLVVQWTERQLQAVIPALAGTAQTLTPQDETASAANTFKLEVLKYVPDFVIDTATGEVTTRSEDPKNPAILVAVNGPSYHNHRWVFANFPDFTMLEDGRMAPPGPLRLLYQSETRQAPINGPIKSFRSTLQVMENETVAATRVVEVNRPMKYKGYTFYQTGYNPDDLSWTSLEVVRDPGVPLVYAGFGLIIAGLFIVFYLNPWMTKREAIA
jgi:cytochrome c biogenesis protein ResB